MKEDKAPKEIEENTKKKSKIKYLIEGQVGDHQQIPTKEFQLKAYAIRDNKVVGVSKINERGEFKIEFEYPSKVGIRVILAPDIPEKYHDYLAGANICMETIQYYVTVQKWEGRSAYLKMAQPLTVSHLIDHWRWWMRPFNVSGRVVFKSTGLGIPFAIVEAIEVDTLSRGGFHQDTVGVTTANSCGNFKITFPWFLVIIPTSRPDLIFKVSENIDGGIRVIYEEDPSQTRWDMIDNSWVLLEVEEECTWINPPDQDQPGDCSFLLTRVGLECADRIDSNGYAESSLLPIPGTGDRPFGVRQGTRNLDICGWFGESSDVTHYKIQYRKAGSTSYKDISDPTSNKYYDRNASKWITMSMGPMELGGVKNLYTTPYIVDRLRAWYLPDLLVQWDSRNADGNDLYSLRIIGYKWDGTSLSLATCLDIDPVYGSINLQIDNSAPRAEIISIVHFKAGGTSRAVQPCDIVMFEPGDELRVTFEASDAIGHLQYYDLNAMYGHNCSVRPVWAIRPVGAIDNYAPTHITQTQKWVGGIYTVVYRANDYGVANGSCVPGNIPTCAYQFRLGVQKRTTDGYGFIYPWVEDTRHITIMRSPGPVIAPGLGPGSGVGGTVVPTSLPS